MSEYLNRRVRVLQTGVIAMVAGHVKYRDGSERVSLEIAPEHDGFVWVPVSEVEFVEETKLASI